VFIFLPWGSVRGARLLPLTHGSAHISQQSVETPASRRSKNGLRPQRSASFKAKILGVEIIEMDKENRRGSVSSVAPARPATSPVPSMLAREKRKAQARLSAGSSRSRRSNGSRPKSTPAAGVRTGTTAIRSLGRKAAQVTHTLATRSCSRSFHNARVVRRASQATHSD